MSLTISLVTVFLGGVLILSCNKNEIQRLNLISNTILEPTGVFDIAVRLLKAESADSKKIKYKLAQVYGMCAQGTGSSP